MRRLKDPGAEKARDLPVISANKVQVRYQPEDRAKALDIEIPSAPLARTDDVIE
jgi:hypothetical protein